MRPNNFKKFFKKISIFAKFCKLFSSFFTLLIGLMI